jgi:penicillin amidase
VACRREPPKTPAPLTPIVSGTMALAGLSAPVRVIRDQWGVPHIYATNRDDLFMTQGFVQAEDRLFQMDLWRRTALGRLAQVLGLNFVARDAMTRRIQYDGDLDVEWASYGPDAKAIAAAFIRGVNAWVALARARPPEEFVLAGWQPDRWAPEDLLARTDAFAAGDRALGEVFRAQLVASVGIDRANALLASQPPIAMPAQLSLSLINFTLADTLREIGPPPFFIGLARPVAASNAWAISSNRSATRKPIVANDPHQLLDNPSPYYLVHLSAPGWNVAGATPPWLPGVALGHNDRVAWGRTAVDADVQDLYVEKLNPQNRHQVEDRGDWIDTRVVRDRVWVNGQRMPSDFEREYTPHGVVIAVDSERHVAFTLKWSGMEPGGGALAVLGLDRAASWPDFRAALGRWKTPAAAFTYADVDGTIASQVAALMPVRRGFDGALPAAGWTRTSEWNGWATLDELPHDVNPRDGLEIAANSSTARLSRLRELLGAAPRFDVPALAGFQTDSSSWNAAMLVPLLAYVRSNRDDVERARTRLFRWDRNLSVDSGEAALYVLWERELRHLWVRPRVPAALADELADRASEGFVPALLTPSRVWFDGDVKAARNRLVLDALTAALDELLKAGAHGPWGTLHQTTFEHPLAINGPAKRRFNVGPFVTPGYGESVIATGGPSFNAKRGASFRAVYDLSDWDRTLVVNAPGQSGSPSSFHFNDLAKLWAEGGGFPLTFSSDEVNSVAESVLTLIPAPPSPADHRRDAP